MKRQQRVEATGPMAGHVRDGRRYLSPLAATGVLHMADWVRDDLPDLLWPVLVLSTRGTSSAIGFVRWQEAVQADLAGLAEPQALADGLDGRLTSLDRLVARLPEAEQSIRQRAAEYALLPSSVVNVLASYPARPAAWLIDHDSEQASDAELNLLAKAILEVLQDGHREAVVKCLHIWSAVQAGTFRSSTETIELLKDYPNNDATRSMADSVIRAMWGARNRLILHEDATSFDASINWAKIFWDVNSMTTRCIRRRDTDDPERDQEDPGPEAGPAPSPEGGEHLRQLAMDLLSSYVEALEQSSSRLYDQEQQEVHAGLVARAGRDVIAALGARDLWCTEHGAHIVRMLVEVRIYLQWMAVQDPLIYRTFQEYGAGKAKLYAQMMEEIPADARHSDFDEAVDELSRLSHNHDVLDYRIVDTRDSFAQGMSIRAMAKECGLLDLYRHTYSLASGIAHSEWWSIESHAMERCLNVLHRGHLIPNLSLNEGGNVDLAQSWVDQLYTLIRTSLRILGTDQEAVYAAFSWLDIDKASRYDEREAADGQADSGDIRATEPTLAPDVPES